MPALLAVGTGPDATSLIATLVAIYTFLISVIVVLLADTVKAAQQARSGRGPPSADTPAPVTPVRRFGTRWRFWSALIVALMLMIAIGFDCYRIENSIGDLLSTTLRNLDEKHVRDAAHEAQRGWFPGNFAVIAVALIYRIGSTTAPEGEEDSRGWHRLRRRAFRPR